MGPGKVTLGKKLVMLVPVFNKHVFQLRGLFMQDNLKNVRYNWHNVTFHFKTDVVTFIKIFN